MNKIVKRILIGIAIFFGVIIIAAAALTIWQWSNIRAFYHGWVTDEETLKQEAREEDERLSEEIKNALEMDIRDFTEEELAMIESGEKTRTEIIAAIIAESATDSVNNDEQGVNAEGPALPETQQKPAQETSDQIVARHVAQLTAYQSEFEGRVSALAGNAESFARSYMAAHPEATKRDAQVAAMQQYMSSASSIESECYAKVDAVIASLRADLKAIGADASIADTVAASAEKQMEIKKSQIMSQYKSKLG